VKLVCGWCRRSLGEIEDGDTEHPITSHGLCESCAFRLSAQLGVPLQQYLDSLGVPVTVMDADAAVLMVNAPAAGILDRGKPLRGLRAGDVFECANAQLPGGCGRTIHCSGCTLRRTVTDTFATGRSHLRVPASLRRGRNGDGDAVALRITTEKVGGVVLVRIDHVGPAPAPDA
jgi:hypothetical protein